MAETNISLIAVLGAGYMGPGIAQSFLMHGLPVMLCDLKDSILQKARKDISNSLDLFNDFSLLKQDKQTIMTGLRTTTSFQKAVEEADFVIEAVTEELSLKQKLFRDLEQNCKPSTILATNTSSLAVNEIGENMQDKSRLIATHWFTPPPILPIVEVVPVEQTSDQTIRTTMDLLRKIGKTPIRIKIDIPGFLINRVQFGMIRELFSLIEKGIADPEDVDHAIMGTIGFHLTSLGPLVRADLGGLDVWLMATENVFPTLDNTTVPQDFLEKMVKKGDLGVKTGRGFYEYGDQKGQTSVSDTIKNRDRNLLLNLRRWRESGL